MILAPLTRLRCQSSDGIPNDMMTTYYSQRCSFGFLITEAVYVSERSAYPGSCGIINKEQMEGWKKLVDSVHKNNGTIVIQLWHCGRATHPKLFNDKKF